MDQKYDPTKVERKWQERWQETGLYEFDLDKATDPYYNLMMFPYPSAEGLHVGNVYAFTGADIHGRFMAMRGHDVFEPMGFDAFGIHSENFAIKRGIHPKTLIAQNVLHFREQLRRLGGRFAWSHAVETTDPDYYRWTQWIFLQLYKGGLAHRQKAPVNWCPSCKTVLANEQVISGRCERCDTEVTQRELEQWFFDITRYADRLLDNLDHLDWSDVIKTAQRNWIGRSDGAELRFPLAEEPAESIAVFTTRPDTVYGATFLVLAPEHPLVAQLTPPERRAEVHAYVRAALDRKAEERSAAGDKSGVFTGGYAKNPFTDQPVPVWVAEYVLWGYGTGAIMAVPGHDERDFAFAARHGLPILRVVAPAGFQGSDLPELAEAYTEYGTAVHSEEFSGLPSEQAKQAIIARAEALGIGTRRRTYHLRNWLISRQRYWGPPIPMVYCDRCGLQPVPENQLPVRLPDVVDFVPKGTGESPLAAIPEFVETTCPQCGGPARRETDVSDNFLDSAWYFLRYPSSGDKDHAFDPVRTQKWLPVEMYIGGKEHAVLHLLYTRFLCMALHDLGFLSFEEPFEHFRAHGIITRNGAKMSKSRGNVVNPDEFFDRYGADTLRAYLMFTGPYEEGGDFSDHGIEGVHRFLHRLYHLVRENGSSAAAEAKDPVVRRRHRLIRRVTEDIEVLKYNTVLAALMEQLNFLQREPQVAREDLKTMVLLLAPLAPHIAEELWEGLGEKGSVHKAPWPRYDPDLCREDIATIVVQVDGKLRDRVQVPAGAPEDFVRQAAMESEAVSRHVASPDAARYVFVPNRLLNIVTK
ncbi:MAG: leucine--tRNA ligase [Thermaerobacter sp.]|nr:leucine--tRNA ligase [Thermaerobacter sp.]